VKDKFAGMHKETSFIHEIRQLVVTYIRLDRFSATDSGRLQQFGTPCDEHTCSQGERTLNEFKMTSSAFRRTDHPPEKHIHPALTFAVKSLRITAMQHWRRKCN
jgi:hypothetical protein